MSRDNNNGTLNNLKTLNSAIANPSQQITIAKYDKAIERLYHMIRNNRTDIKDINIKLKDIKSSKDNNHKDDISTINQTLDEVIDVVNDLVERMAALTSDSGSDEALDKLIPNNPED